MRFYIDWKVGFCDSAEARPDETFPAVVPGAVQLDYARRYGLPDYRRGTNFEEYRWMEDKYWVYSAEVQAAELDGESLFLIVKGIDYRYDILINGETICSYEGMYREWDFDLTHLAVSGFIIEIVVYPAPKSSLRDVHKDTRDEANQCCKPAVSYGWDFHPRLVPLGIWNDIYMERVQRKVLLKPNVEYTLSDDLSRAEVCFSADGSPDAEWELRDPRGKVIFTGVGERCRASVEQVQLWWCSGYGEPDLYTWMVRAKGSEAVSGKLGFRKVALTKAPGSWGELTGYPMTRNTPPVTVTLNNVQLFAKGTNWVAPEIFYGTLDYDRYRGQLELVKKANLNFVRCWGGAVINKEPFFDICDELGIMVWQEFPLACNNYQGTEHYLSVLKTEAEAIIDRLKKHACLILWCGGNELFNNWSLMTDQSAALRLLNKLTYEKTPETPYLPTAPVMGMGHGNYQFNYCGGREVIQVMAESRFTAYTEFGIPACSNLETLKLIGDPEELFPFCDNAAAAAHGEHLKSFQLERYFGKVDSLESYMKYTQLLQCVGLQFIYEEARRQKPYCSIASNWCLNEPWPNTGNNSVVGYPGSIKPAYYSVAAACRSVLASARIRKFSYLARETLEFDLYLLNDSLRPVEDGAVEVSVQIGDNFRAALLKWEYKQVQCNTNAAGPTVRYSLPVIEDAEYIKIILDCGDYSSKYTLLYRLPDKPVDAPRKMNALLEDNMDF